MHAIAKLHSLVATKQPLYLITTSHGPTPTYFGAVPPAHASSSPPPPGIDPVTTVFAFKDRALAVDVAQGLEMYKQATGAYPPMDCEELDLTCYDGGGAELLRELDIRETSVPEVLRLVSGSGLAISVMYRDTPNESCRSVDVRPSRGVDRSWLEKTVFQTFAEAPSSAPAQLLQKPDRSKYLASGSGSGGGGDGGMQRDPVTAPNKRADDLMGRLFVFVWMMLVSMIS